MSLRETPDIHKFFHTIQYLRSKDNILYVTGLLDKREFNVTQM